MELKGAYDHLLKGNNSTKSTSTSDESGNLGSRPPPKSSGIFKAFAWIGRSLVETSPNQNLSEEIADIYMFTTVFTIHI